MFKIDKNQNPKKKKKRKKVIIRINRTDIKKFDDFIIGASDMVVEKSGKINKDY